MMSSWSLVMFVHVAGTTTDSLENAKARLPPPTTTGDPDPEVGAEKESDLSGGVALDLTWLRS